MLTTVFPALGTTVNLGGINHIFVSGRRQFSGQRFYYPKMRQQSPEEGKPRIGPTPKPRGHPRDPPDIRISKSLSWLLRHGAEKAGLNIREDGYAKVSDVVSPQHQCYRDRLSSLCQTACEPHVQRCHIHALARYCETRPKITIPSSV